MNRPSLGGLGALGGKAGLATVGAGLLLIGIGWNGAAGQLSVVAQLPYLVSGGLLGLALVVLGAAVLVVQSAREDRAMLEAKLDVLTQVLIEAAGPRPDAPGDASGLVAAGTASYHVPTCRLVDGREQTTYLTADEAAERQLKPCRVCHPQDAATQTTVW